MENEKVSYQKQWDYFRWLIRIYFITLIIFLPCIFLFVIKEWTILEKTLVIIGGLAFAGNVIVYLNIIFWTCPRCGELYFRWWNNQDILFAKECTNCGLKKYEGSNIEALLS